MPNLPNPASQSPAYLLRWARGLLPICLAAIIVLYVGAQPAHAQGGNCNPSPTLFRNQGDVSADQNDPNLADNTAAVCTPLVTLTTSYLVGKELSTIDPVRPGEAITFTVRITNTGQTVLTSLPISDTYNRRYLQYINASPASDDNNDDGQLDWSDLTTSLGDLAPNGVAVLTVRFSAFSDTSLLPNGATINRVAGHDALTGSTPAPNPPVASAQVRINAPTAVALANKTVQIVNKQVVVRWSTVSETPLLGFYLWREDGRGQVVRITNNLLTAQKAGQSSGSDYTYSDLTATPGAYYRYVLELLDTDGHSSYSELGRIGSKYAFYLPGLHKR